MQKQEQAAWVREGRCALGIELGSTRIKAVLIGPDHAPVAMGAHDWENRLEDGVWTYHLDDVWAGIQDAYADLAKNTLETCGEPLARLEAVGISAMMHGYLPFDAAGNQLAPFRTWRNTMTAKAAEELTALFSFNIPQRWSIAHLYQAILNGEEHVKDIAFLTTLAGYVHWKLTGVKALGVGDASGMFPIDSETGDYDAGMLAAFDAKIAAKGYPWKLRDILPEVLGAGEDAGCLTEAGARLLDPTGALEAGAPLCPAEGDAGTGMVATNSVAAHTGNVSAGRPGGKTLPAAFQLRADLPVFFRDERLDFILSVDNHARRHALHTAGAQALFYLGPQDGAYLVAHEPVQHTARLLRVDALHVQGARMLDGLFDGLVGNLMEFHAAGRTAVHAENVGQMPGNGLPFAVRVGGQQDLRRGLGLAAQAVQHFAPSPDGNVFRLEIMFHIHAHLRLGQIPNMAIAGLHFVAAPQELSDGARLGGGLNDYELALCCCQWCILLRC